MAPKRAPPRLADPGGEQFPIGVDRRFAGSGEGPPCGNGFGKTHQRDAERAGQQLLDQGEIGQGQRRETLRDQADDRYALVLRGRRTRTPQCRRRRPPAAPANAATGAPCRSAMPASPAPTASVSSEVSGRCWTRREQVAEKALLGEMDAEQLGHLVEDDDQADSRLESGQHRAGDEVGDKAEAQQRGQRSAARRPGRSASPRR